MKKYIPIICILALLLLSGCEREEPVPTHAFTPEVSPTLEPTSTLELSIEESACLQI